MRLPRSQFVANENLVIPSTAAEEWYNVFLTCHRRGMDCYTFLQLSRHKLQRGSHPPAPSSSDLGISCRRTIGSVRALTPPILQPPTRHSTSLTKPIIKVVKGQPPRLMSDLPPHLSIDPSELHFEKFRRGTTEEGGECQSASFVSGGTFGTVHRAVWRNKNVAVKLSHIDNPPSYEQLKNFERELNTYVVIKDDPNVCRFYGACVKNLRTLLIVTEYVPRGNAFDLLFDNKHIVAAEHRLKMARQLAAVVTRLHAHKPTIIHRDLKTPNILVDDDYNIKLCDFGKTRFMSRSSIQLDDNGGSPRYMAPECYVMNGSICEKSDIWSLACCLIEVFGGPIPYEECFENEEVVHKLLTLRQPPCVPHWFQPSIRRLLSSCFDWTPANRPLASVIHHVLLHEVTARDLEAFGMTSKNSRPPDPQTPRLD